MENPTSLPRKDGEKEAHSKPIVKSVVPSRRCEQSMFFIALIFLLAPQQ